MDEEKILNKNKQVEGFNCKQFLIHTHQILVHSLNDPPNFLEHPESDAIFRTEDLRKIIQYISSTIKKIQIIRDDVGLWLEQEYDNNLQDTNVNKNVQEYAVFNSSYDIFYVPQNATGTWTCKEVIRRIKDLLLQKVFAITGLINYMLSEESSLLEKEEKKLLLDFCKKLEAIQELFIVISHWLNINNDKEI